jgi:hypothetical protein
VPQIGARWISVKTGPFWKKNEIWERRLFQFLCEIARFLPGKQE